jgi:hypothetical protein
MAAVLNAGQGRSARRSSSERPHCRHDDPVGEGGCLHDQTTDGHRLCRTGQPAQEASPRVWKTQRATLLWYREAFVADNFSVSKDSIQLPYRRFLADSAAGLSLLLIAVAAYYLPVVSDAPFREAWHSYEVVRSMHGVGNEIKALVLLVLFLLATPIGFAVNALSWILIDYSICASERLYFRWTRQNGLIFPLWDVTQARFGAHLNSFFGLEEKNFNVAGWFFRDVLEAYVPDRFETQTHIKGLVVFVRNLILYAVILGFVSLAHAVTSVLGNLAVVMSVLGATFLLVFRWGRNSDASESDPKVPVSLLARIAKWPWVNISVAAITIVSLILIFAVGDHGNWRVRAAILFGVAVVAVALIGMVEYYYHDAILLHAYFACCEYGVQEPSIAGTQRFLVIAQELIRKVAESAAQKGK